MAPLMVVLLCIVHRAAGFDFNGYIMERPCTKTTCFQKWGLGSIELAIVINGRIQADSTPVEESKCSLSIHALSNQQSFCSRESCEPGVDCEPFTPVINTYPGQNTSLQCVLLSSLDSSSCTARPFGRFVVVWLDENGKSIKEGAEYRITRNSACDVRLTVSLQSPKNASFSCLAGVPQSNTPILTSKRIQVTVPRLRGAGRGAVLPQPGDGESAVQAGSSSVVAPTVGALCAVAVGAAALFVLKKKRSNTRTSIESHTSTPDCALDPDEVIYADINFPVSPDRMSVSVYENTVYASVRCS